MIIVKIVGGLGNQMFQYAYAKALQDSEYEVKLDVTAFNKYRLHGGFQLDHYKTDIQIANDDDIKKFGINTIKSKLISKIGMLPRSQILESSASFDKYFLQPEDNIHIVGYFQSYKYFLSVDKLLRKQFNISTELSDYGKSVHKEIQESGQTCSIHVRRGDYLLKKNANHVVLPIEYYKRSIEFYKKNFGNIKFFVFSDDIEWARNFFSSEEYVIVGSGTNRNPHEDIELMKMCSHNIIANSTFSWWAAWLNPNEIKCVTVPSMWFVNVEQNKVVFEDLIPEEWCKI